MDLVDGVRTISIALSAGLMWVCMMRVVRDWLHWSHRERVVRVHLTAYLLVLAYGTVEALAAGTPPGTRVWLAMVVHTSFALALWRTRNEPAQP